MPKLPDPLGARRPAPSAGGGLSRYRPVDSGSVAQIDVGSAADLRTAGAGLKAGGSLLLQATERDEAQLRAAQQKVRSGQDAVGRARAYGAFGESANNELRRLQIEEDLSDPDTVQKYGQFLRDSMAKALESHKGSQESQLRLMQKLEADRFKYVDRVAVQSTAAGERLIGGHVGRTIRTFAARASGDPSTLSTLFAEFDETLVDLAPAMQPHQEQAYQLQARQVMAQQAIQALILQQRYVDAERVLTLPGMSEILDPEANGKIKAAIFTSRKALRDERLQGIRAGQNAIDKAQTILDRELTAEERERVAGVESPYMDLRRRALNIIVDGAANYEVGLMSPEDEAAFEGAVTSYMTPKTMNDPTTNMPVTIQPKLPPRVAESLRSRGFSITDDMVDPLWSRNQQTPQATAAITAQQDRPQGDPLASIGGKTIWAITELVSGPVPWGAVKLGDSPILGTLVRPRQFAQAKSYIPIIQRALVTALSNSPKFAEGERLSIERDITIDAAFWDNPAAFRDRLIGIDLALAQRADNALSDINSPGVGAERRRWAQQKYDAIIRFRIQLGVPARLPLQPDMHREWMLNRVDGSEFIAPDGAVRTISHSRIHGAGN